MTRSIQEILDEQRNLSRIHKKSEHAITATIQAHERSRDPEWIRKITELNRARAQDPEALARHRATMQSDEYKQAHRAGTSTEEYRALKSQESQQRWQDPAYRELQSERLNDPEVKAKQRAAAQKRELNPDYQRRKREWAAKWKDDPERSAKISQARRAYFEAHPEARQELSNRAQQCHAQRTQEDYARIHAKRREDGTWLEAVTQAAKKRRQPLLTPDGVFDSKKQAHLHYGFDPAMVDYNRRKKPLEWFFISVEDYEKCLADSDYQNQLRKLRLAGQYEEVVRIQLTQEQKDARKKPKNR